VRSRKWSEKRRSKAKNNSTVYGKGCPYLRGSPFFICFPSPPNRSYPPDYNLVGREDISCKRPMPFPTIPVIPVCSKPESKTLRATGPTARRPHVTTPNTPHPPRGRRKNDTPRPVLLQRDGPRKTHRLGWGRGMPKQLKRPRMEKPVHRARGFSALFAPSKRAISLWLLLCPTAPPDRSIQGRHLPLRPMTFRSSPPGHPVRLNDGHALLPATQRATGPTARRPHAMTPNTPHPPRGRRKNDTPRPVLLQRDGPRKMNRLGRGRGIPEQLKVPCTEKPIHRARSFSALFAHQKGRYLSAPCTTVSPLFFTNNLHSPPHLPIFLTTFSLTRQPGPTVNP